MKARSTKLAVEKLEDRCMPSTLVEANFNNDAYMDKAEITSPTTITVSLGSADGYTVSAILTAPKSLPNGGLSVLYYGDVNPDIYTYWNDGTRFHSHTWLGNGDGTFGHRVTEKSNKLNEW